MVAPEEVGLMRSRSTVIVLVLAVMLGAYIFVFERKQPTPEERREKAKKLLAFEPADVRELRIERAGETVVLEKEGDTWFLRQPLRARADEVEVERILSGLQDVEVERRLEADEGSELDPADYGLDAPRARVVFSAGDTEYELRVGFEAVAGGNMYVSSGSAGAVMLVRSDLHRELAKPVDLLRSRAVIDLDPHAVARIEIERPGEVVRLEREGPGEARREEWRLNSPVSARASGEEVERFLGKLRGMRVEEFLPEDSGRAAEFGLAPPRFAVTVGDGGPENEKTILFGKKVKDGEGVYCKRGSVDSVYVVREDVLDGLDIGVEQFRDRKLVRTASRDGVRSISVSAGERTLLLSRAGDGWEIASPVAAKGDAEAVETLLDRIEALEAEKFVAETADALRLKRYGLTRPALAVRVVEGPVAVVEEEEGGDARARTTEVLFGKKKGGLCYARRSDEPAVVLVDAGILELAGWELLDYRSRRVLGFKRDEVMELAVTLDGRATIRRKAGGGWEAEQPEGMEVDEARVGDILWELYDLKASGIVGEDVPETSARCGLDTPWARVSLTFGDGDAREVLSLELGGKDESGAFYARASGNEAEGLIFAVSGTVADSVSEGIVRQSVGEK